LFQMARLMKSADFANIRPNAARLALD